MSAFREQMMNDFPNTAPPLWDLARDYHQRTEEYDRTICSGPIGPDGIRPNTTDERGLSSRNARAVMESMKREVEARGFTMNDLRRTIQDFSRSGDMRRLLNTFPSSGEA